MSGDNGAPRKRVCLGVPSYSPWLAAGAAQGCACASDGKRLDVHFEFNQGSLLALSFNALWCRALNLAKAGGLDYFAMLHTDVGPNNGWLDALVAELDATGLDVLSVVVPIKDPRGVTSTALARDDGDPFGVFTRLTMQEVFRLPETFTSADVGGRPLLVNTGCWV